MKMNQHLPRVGLVLALSSMLFACGGEETPAEPETPVVEAAPVVEAPVEPAPEPVAATLPAPTEAQLAEATATGATARAIDAEPARAEAILTERNTDADRFEASIYTIAAHPELTQAFLTARTAPQ